MVAPGRGSSTLPRVSPSRFAPLVLISLLAFGCRYATEKDCEHIIDRIVELELKEQGITNPDLIEQRKAETRRKKRDELITGCVGKRITDAAMTCIDNASSSKDITQRCLR